MRAWVVARDKRFAQYIVRIPAETPNQCIPKYVVNCLQIPAKTPAQVMAQEDRLYV